ncbi:hypothetical protein ABZP36_003738 [Zizania latifolia]
MRHELPEQEEAYVRSCMCRLTLIDQAISRKKPPLNAFKLASSSTQKHVNGKRFLNKLETMASGEMDEDEAKLSNEAAKKSKSRKKDEKKADVIDDSDDSDDLDFWVPPVGSRWDDDDDEKDRWDSSPLKDDAAPDEGELDGGEDDDDMADKDDEETISFIFQSIVHAAWSGDIFSCSRTKRLSVAVGPSSFASRKKKPKKDQ